MLKKFFKWISLILLGFLLFFIVQKISNKEKDLIALEDYKKTLVGEWYYCEHPSSKFTHKRNGNVLFGEEDEGNIWILEGDILIIKTKDRKIISIEKILKFKEDYYETFLLSPPVFGEERDSFCRVR